MFKLLATLILVYNTNIIGSLEINFDRIVPLAPQPKFLNNFTGQVSKFNRSTYMLNLDADLYKWIDNRFSLRVDAFARQGNEYRKIFTKIHKDVCNFVENDQLFYNDLVQHSNLPKACPAQPKHYAIKNYVLSLPDTLPALFLIAEHWKINFSCELKGRAVIAAETYFNIKRF